MHFNSHAHVERDLLSSLWQNQPMHFNSHAHVERDPPGYGNVYKNDNFNSHAHVERDVNGVVRRKFERISTHTLTWSVTAALLSFR